MTKRREAFTPPQTLSALFAAAGDSLVLVGGQALALWALRFDILPPQQVAAVSRDVDFLSESAADTASVERLAKSFGGQPHFPGRRALTSLVGQAIRGISDEEYINVDVIWKVIGIDAAAIRKHAVVVPDTLTHAEVKVMHPLDVLASRLANLHKLAEKQDEKGKAQLELAILVAREFLRREAKELAAAATASGRSPIQGYVGFIEKLAKDDAGRKVAKRWGVHVADAIDPHLIPAGPFWTKRWPSLQKLMSPAYRAGITEPQLPSATKARKKP